MPLQVLAVEKEVIAVPNRVFHAPLCRGMVARNGQQRRQHKIDHIRRPQISTAEEHFIRNRY